MTKLFLKVSCELEEMTKKTFYIFVSELVWIHVW